MTGFPWYSHTRNSLVNHYSEREGGYLGDRLTVHYTPKHGSWLNQAEIELSMYSRQCLGKRRFSDVGTLRRETKAWNRTANRKGTKITWRFTRRKANYRMLYFFPKAEKTKGRTRLDKKSKTKGEEKDTPRIVVVSHGLTKEGGVPDV